MVEYIEREAVLKNRFNMYTGFFGNIPVVAVRDIEALPAADAVEVKHGRWVKKFERYHDTHTDEYWDEEYCSCPLCGKDSDLEHNFCPNCGARMDGED